MSTQILLRKVFKRVIQQRLSCHVFRNTILGVWCALLFRCLGVRPLCITVHLTMTAFGFWSVRYVSIRESRFQPISRLRGRISKQMAACVTLICDGSNWPARAYFCPVKHSWLLSIVKEDTWRRRCPSLMPSLILAHAIRVTRKCCPMEIDPRV